jgi:hypothetical protein
MRRMPSRYQNVKRPHRENPPVTYLRYFGTVHRSNIEIDIRKGLPRIREQWILDRNDVEELNRVLITERT